MAAKKGTQGCVLADLSRLRCPTTEEGGTLVARARNLGKKEKLQIIEGLSVRLEAELPVRRVTPGKVSWEHPTSFVREEERPERLPGGTGEELDLFLLPSHLSPDI